MKLIKMPSIDQFRRIVKQVCDQAAYVETGEDGVVVYDYLKPKPVLIARGTVKVHGTNAGVSCKGDEMWFQSKANIITIEKDNNGFAAFGNSRREAFVKMFDEVKATHKLTDQDTVTIYGEWAGGGIQKGVAINGLDRFFAIFGVKITPEDEGQYAYWVEYSNLRDNSVSIYNIDQFGVCAVEIDFNNPQEAQNEIIELTLAVERECPVGKFFGVSGIGEGLVFTINGFGHPKTFKSKGELHSKSKVKTLSKVDLERLSLIDACVDEITHDWRFEQGLVEIYGSDYEHNLDRKMLGKFINWVTTDTLKEEYDLIESHGFEPKEVMGKVSQKAKEYYFAAESSCS